MWNDPQEVPYAYKGNQWMEYDNSKSFTLKVGPSTLFLMHAWGEVGDLPSSCP